MTALPDHFNRHYWPRWGKLATLLAALGLIIGMIGAILTASPANAKQARPVTAGDTITHGHKECTLGYVYRVPRHTMGVSAGHCADLDTPSAPVVNTDANIAGRSVSVTYVPNTKSGPPLRDWWLIDFGDVAWSDRLADTGNHITGYVNAKISDWVCHYGSASRKEICGLVSEVDTPLITVTQTGKSGDSGGPTYLTVAENHVALVGLWQGHSTDPDRGGYAMSLPAALTYFRQFA